MTSERPQLPPRDTDVDGLTDDDERKFGTNPEIQDTDGDGLSDKEEWQRRTDRTRQDTDFDGLGDWVEMLQHSNPKSAYSGGAADRTTDLEDVERALPQLRAAERAKMVPEGIYDEFGNRIVFPGDASNAAFVSGGAMADPAANPFDSEASDFADDSWFGDDNGAVGVAADSNDTDIATGQIDLV